MKPEQAAALRAPFPPETIGKLPKPTKRDNPKGRCEECGGWHGLPAVHLDYVGHAAVTDRLLAVDPEWTWEPMARNPDGSPQFANGGLWILLTVAGVTRPGFGDESNGRGTKEVIGDAIRNAAMRFGVALDLWAKEPLDGAEPDHAPPQDRRRGERPEPVPATPDTGTPQPDRSGAASPEPAVPQTTGEVPPAASEAQRRRMFALFRERGIGEREARLDFVAGVIGRRPDTTTDMTGAEVSYVMDALERADKRAPADAVQLAQISALILRLAGREADVGDGTRTDWNAWASEYAGVTSATELDNAGAARLIEALEREESRLVSALAIATREQEPEQEHEW